MPFVDGVVADADFFWFRGDAEDGHVGAGPPGLKDPVRGAAPDRDGVGRHFAGILHAEEFAFLVGERVAVVLIQRAVAISP